MPTLVDFPGHGRFWLTDGNALAPLEHCDENGDILIQSVLEHSYAHVYGDGYIKRYGTIIGHSNQLVTVREDYEEQADQ